MQKDQRAIQWFERAKKIQRAADGIGLGQRATSDERDRFYQVVSCQELRRVSLGLFENGHYSQAIYEAFKALDNAVKEKSRQHDLSGAKLMRRVFSPKNPELELNNLRSTSDKDEQQGYMDIFAGAMTGIRNPRAHENVDDQLANALELLGICNHLMLKLQHAKPSDLD